MLRALKRPRRTAGRGKKLGIDASILEANASMRTLEQRLSDIAAVRRTILRGQPNTRKRYLIQAMSCNGRMPVRLSLLMRSLTGIGTAKQALATGLDALEHALIYVLRSLREAPLRPVAIRSFSNARVWQKLHRRRAAGSPPEQAPRRRKQHLFNSCLGVCRT